MGMFTWLYRVTFVGRNFSAAACLGAAPLSLLSLAASDVLHRVLFHSSAFFLLCRRL
jgi:hypothetical protein